MPDRNKHLTKKIRARINITEHILNVFKAMIATAPFCGGIASLMSDYIPSAKLKRLEEFVQWIAQDLEHLQNRIDESRILSDEFAFMFEKCFKGVAENYQSEKLEAFRGILVNSAIGFPLSEEEKEYFLNLVNALSVLHMRILKFMAISLEYLDEMDIARERITGGFSEFFPAAVPGVNLDVIKSAFGDLYQYGLINTDKSIFGTTTSGQGLALLRNRVTSLGARLINFCKAPEY